MKAGMYVTRKVQAISENHLFIEYRTYAHKNSRKATIIMRFEVACRNSEKLTIYI